MTKVIDWLNEIADTPPQSFHEYFYDDIRRYIEDVAPEGDRIKALYDCKSKSQVKDWLGLVAGHIVMRLDTESIIQEYLED